jgi:hypothetical protein
MRYPSDKTGFFTSSSMMLSGEKSTGRMGFEHSFSNRGIVYNEPATT